MLQQFRETCVRLVPFREVIDVDCPKAIARVERMLRSLEAYGQMSSPQPGAPGDAAGQGAASVVRQADDAAAASPAAPATAAAPAPTPAGGAP